MITRCRKSSIILLKRSFAVNLKKSPQILSSFTRLSLNQNEKEEEALAMERTVKAKTIRELRAIKDEYENDGGNQERVKTISSKFSSYSFLT